jgi:hypothetical protein
MYVESWLNRYETKSVGLTFVDNHQVLGRITEWITTPEDKIINLKFNMAEANTTVDNPVIPENKGDDWSVFDYLQANTNQMMNHLLGTDLPEEGFLPSLINKLLYGDEKGNGRGKPIEFAKEIELLPEFKPLSEEELNKGIDAQVDGLEMHVNVVPELDDTAAEKLKYEIESENGGVVTFKVDNVKLKPNNNVILPDETIGVGNRTIEKGSVGGYGAVNPQYVTFNNETEEKDNIRDTNNVETGVRRGTDSMLSAIRDLLDVARAINRKDFTIQFTPSTAWAKNNSASNRQYETVTGDVP